LGDEGDHTPNPQQDGHQVREVGCESDKERFSPDLADDIVTEML
jgi:hypothetical protein